MGIKQALNFCMKNILREILVSLIILLPSICHALPAESPNQFPNEFRATYTVETYGIIVAKATYILKHKTNGLIFTQHSAPVGFASFFKNETLQETSHLSLHNDQLLLNEYSFIQNGGDKNRDISLKIDWIVSDNKFSGRIVRIIE